MKSSIFGTYKNDTRAHGFHIHKTAPSMATTTMCTFKSDQHALPNLKCVLRCFPQYPSIIISYQESNKDKTKKIPTIYFHVYRKISHCTLLGQRLYDGKTILSMCSTGLKIDTNTKLQSRKVLLLMETYITELHEKFYIL